jgi:hypothetical protein
MVSTESAMRYSTFNGGNGDIDIKSRKFDDMLENSEDIESTENVDDAFEQLVVSLLHKNVTESCTN